MLFKKITCCVKVFKFLIPINMYYYLSNKGLSVKKFTALTISVMLFSPIISLAEIKLDEAKKLVNQKKYFDALKLVSPCLKAVSTKNIPNLEDCLYEGEKIAELAVEELSQQLFKLLKNLKMENYPDYLSYYAAYDAIRKKLEGPYVNMGIHLFYCGSGAEYWYKSEFFKRLKEIFPKSKYRAEYEYVLIDKSAHVNNWEDWISELENYIKNFPTGKYSLRAKLDLAYNYDDLWNIIHPNHDWSFLGVTFPKDSKLADEYKHKALKLYQEILKTRDKSGMEEYEINEVKKRISDLPKNKKKEGIHILRACE